MLEPRFFYAIDRWVRDATPTGHFLAAVLRNDLVDALGRADEGAIQQLPEIVRHLYNCCPGNCWRTQANIDSWSGLKNEEYHPDCGHKPTSEEDEHDE
jgi:hypothetical protein